MYLVDWCQIWNICGSQMINPTNTSALKVVQIFRLILGVEEAVQLSIWWHLKTLNRCFKHTALDFM